MGRLLLAACAAVLLLAGCPDQKTPRDPPLLPTPKTAPPP